MFNNYKKFNKMTKRKMAMHDQNPHLEAMHWGYIRAFCEAVNETAIALMNQLCLEETSAKFDDLVLSPTTSGSLNTHLMGFLSTTTPFCLTTDSRLPSRS